MKRYRIRMFHCCTSLTKVACLAVLASVATTLLSGCVTIDDDDFDDYEDELEERHERLEEEREDYRDRLEDYYD